MGHQRRRHDADACADKLIGISPTPREPDHHHDSFAAARHVRRAAVLFLSVPSFAYIGIAANRQQDRMTDGKHGRQEREQPFVTNVAALANVSIATASRVLSGNAPRRRHRPPCAAAEQLNYSVNYAAKRTA